MGAGMLLSDAAPAIDSFLSDETSGKGGSEGAVSNEAANGLALFISFGTGAEAG